MRTVLIAGFATTALHFQTLLRMRGYTALEVDSAEQLYAYVQKHEIHAIIIEAVWAENNLYRQIDVCSMIYGGTRFAGHVLGCMLFVLYMAHLRRHKAHMLRIPDKGNPTPSIHQG